MHATHKASQFTVSDPEPKIRLWGWRIQYKIISHWTANLEFVVPHVCVEHTAVIPMPGLMICVYFPWPGLRPDAMITWYRHLTMQGYSLVPPLQVLGCIRGPSPPAKYVSRSIETNG